MVFYRLLEHAVDAAPVTYQDLVRVGQAHQESVACPERWRPNTPTAHGDSPRPQLHHPD
jgi:hypothetical protein